MEDAEVGNQFQGIRLITSSLITTEQKYRRLQRRIVLTVGNILSFLNWRNWFGGLFLLDIQRERELGTHNIHNASRHDLGFMDEQISYIFRCTEAYICLL